ncbi:conserved hypothetical protein [Chlorobaculum parvum NCIB 8327]|uniref:Uncharacterized protein n=1 Tax=Chlorobaculum parvum (strain DSM 263 / NCIMB 8327) TaxID=517417 RepID=B3QKZ5_CHLP8|nr:hypothetical protein [Chlorobaculum parvum]ACF10783.1 conserved hypothetical protein [Chlorobaculum parvum NCIB 8327]
MGTIDDYRTGKIVEGIRKAESALDNRNSFSADDPVFGHIREKIVAFKPVWIAKEQAVEMIQQSRTLAVGERVCRALHPESPETQTVFLDELAEAMAGAGKAEIVTTAEAAQLVNRQSRDRIIASMVSGNYLELCSAHPSDCIFCKAERAGIRCFPETLR